jgi:hypothetical protein
MPPPLLTHITQAPFRRGFFLPQSAGIFGWGLSGVPIPLNSAQAPFRRGFSYGGANRDPG